MYPPDVQPTHRLKDAHGNRVLIGRALVKALARMAKVLMGSLNLTAVTQDMLYDIPIALFSWHKS